MTDPNGRPLTVQVRRPVVQACPGIEVHASSGRGFCYIASAQSGMVAADFDVRGIDYQIVATRAVPPYPGDQAWIAGIVGSFE